MEKCSICGSPEGRTSVLSQDAVCEICEDVMFGELEEKEAEKEIAASRLESWKKLLEKKNLY